MNLKRLLWPVRPLGMAWVVMVLLGWTPTSWADFPARLALVNVEAPIEEIRVNADGTRGVLWLASTRTRPAGIQQVDLSDPLRPRVAKFFPVASAAKNAAIELSPDGRRLLCFSIGAEHGDGGTDRSHLLQEFDLTDLNHPKERWHRNVQASHIKLAPDASAYAVVSQSHRAPARWKTSVVWVDGQRPPVEVNERDVSYSITALSPGGRFILYMNSSIDGIRMFDLKAAVPVMHEQPDAQRGDDRDVWRLDGQGRIVMADSGVSRFFIHSFQAGVPRVATGPLDCLDACGRMAGTTPASIFLANEQNRLYRLDMDRPDHPVVEFYRDLPAGNDLVQVAGKLLVARIQSSASTLAVYSLTSTEPVMLDWDALERAHRQIMAGYQQDMSRPERRSVAAHEPIKRLEAASINLALDAPLNGYSTRQAAAMLNDYGFLLSKQSGSIGRAERVLRRSLDIDSNRSLAILNLADVIASTLGDVTDFSVKTVRTLEAESLYRKYGALTRGQSRRSMETFLKAGSVRDKADDICSAMANYANAGILQELLTTRAVNIPTGGKRLDLGFGYQGSASIPYVWAVDATNDLPIEDFELSLLGGNDRDLWGGDHLGLVVYRDTYHVLHYRDLTHPVMSYALDDRPGCSFETVFSERMGHRSVDPELCKVVKSGGLLSVPAFDKSRGLNEESVRNRYFQTSSDGVADLDLLNNGQRVPVAQLFMSSTAGPGCSAVIFDVVENRPTQARLMSGALHEAIMKLQGLDAKEDRFAAPCGNEARLFRHKGLIHFETRPGQWPPMDAADTYHRVTRFENNKLVDVCDFRLESRVVVKRATR